VRPWQSRTALFPSKYLLKRRYVLDIDKVCESEQELVRMYSVAQFARQVGVSVKTLQRWDREGRLKAKRTLYGLGRDEHEDALSSTRACPGFDEQYPLLFIEMVWPAEGPQSVSKGAPG
jgi:hypothetical protein